MDFKYYRLHTFDRQESHWNSYKSVSRHSAAHVVMPLVGFSDRSKELLFLYVDNKSGTVSIALCLKVLLYA